MRVLLTDTRFFSSKILYSGYAAAMLLLTLLPPNY
jgi:hypothetical protein